MNKSVVKKRRHFGLPLLMKELHEQSGRTRTFVIRVVYATLLFASVVLFNFDQLFQVGNQSVSIGSTLGIGRDLFQSLLWLQFVGVYLFLPAIVCGVLTVEKERNTLGLLLITKLSPWTIILEKFASRIVPMLTFLLISLPVISFTYALGGLESTSLFIGIWFLMLTILQVASLAILASSFFGGTVGSFLGTYVLLGLITFSLPLADWLFFNNLIRSIGQNAFQSWMASSGGYLQYVGGEIVESCFIPPMLLLYTSQVGQYAFVGNSGISITSTLYPIAFIISIPTLAMICANLALARYFLIRRAFVTSTNPLLSLFKFLDRIFVRANNALCGGAVLVKESQTLPGMAPVAWRETAKRSLGQFRYLVRVFVTLELPTGVLIYFAATGRSGNSASSEPVSALMFLLWIISVILIAVSASNLIAGERSRQTLDVLLTTPMTSREIVLQKLEGVRRLMLVCAVPLLTCIAFQTWWRYELSELSNQVLLQTSSGTEPIRFDWLEYLITSLVGLFILFHVTLWLSFWIGMKLRSTSKAILTTLAVLLAWCVVPLMLLAALIQWIYFPGQPVEPERSGIMLWLLLSPAFLVAFQEMESLSQLSSQPYLPMVLNNLIYGNCWILIRYFVLTRADAGLVRIREQK